MQLATHCRNAMPRDTFCSNATPCNTFWRNVTNLGKNADCHRRLIWARNKSWCHLHPPSTALHSTAYIATFSLWKYSQFPTYFHITRRHYLLCSASWRTVVLRWHAGPIWRIKGRLSCKFWNISISRHRHTSHVGHLSENFGNNGQGKPFASTTNNHPQ